MTVRGWHSRGYLPHFDGGERAQFVTFRLADSLPQNVLEKWRAELTRGETTDFDFRRRVEIYLDQGYGARYLQNQVVGKLIEETLLRFDRDKYKLHSWVVMPNHVHFLATPLAENSLTQIIRSVKSYTAHEANKILGRTGRFWFPDYYDRYIRSYEHFEKTANYIENNPVKAGLCEKPSDWQFSSARSHREKR